MAQWATIPPGVMKMTAFWCPENSGNWEDEALERLLVEAVEVAERRSNPSRPGVGVT